MSKSVQPVQFLTRQKYADLNMSKTIHFFIATSIQQRTPTSNKSQNKTKQKTKERLKVDQGKEVGRSVIVKLYIVILYQSTTPHH